MPNPSTSLSTLRPDLAGSFMEYELEMNRRGFIATRVLPVINVAKQSGPFGKIPIEQLLQNPDVKRAPSSAYSRGNFTFTTDTFACEEYGHEEPIDDREAEMYMEYFDAEQIATARAFEFVLQAAEQRAASLIFNTSTFTTTAVSTEWSTYATATPLSDVETEVQAVYGACGMWPNTMVMTRKVFRNLRHVAEVRDRVSSSGAGSSEAQGDISLRQIANVFDLQNVIVANATKNTANEGASASLDSVWDDEYVWIGVVPRTNDIREPGVGRTFHWSEDGSQLRGRVESYRDESVRSDIIRVRHDVDEKVLYAECGRLLSNITA